MSYWLSGLYTAKYNNDDGFSMGYGAALFVVLVMQVVFYFFEAVLASTKTQKNWIYGLLFLVVMFLLLLPFM